MSIEQMQSEIAGLLCAEDLKLEAALNGNDNSAHAEKFPESAWIGLFEEWRKIVGPETEAAEEFLWAVFLLVVGLLLGRNVHFEMPSRHYPNFYALLIGLTGDARKSTAMRFGRELLRKLGDCAEVLTGLVSIEALYDRLEKQPGTVALIDSDEFRSLMAVATARRATSNMLPHLNSLFDCPANASIDRHGDASTHVVDPFVSLITATPKEYVEDLITGLEASGGTLNRFIIIEGRRQRPKPFVKNPSDAQWQRLTDPLAAIRDYWAAKPSRLDFDAEAAQLWEEFYVAWSAEREKRTPLAQNLTARTFVHVYKIALVYAALALEKTITAPTLATAISIGEWLEGNALRAFSTVGISPITKASDLVLGKIKSLGRVPRRELQQWCGSRKIDAKLFGEVIKLGIENGHIRTQPEITAAGHERTIIVHIG